MVSIKIKNYSEVRVIKSVMLVCLLDLDGTILLNDQSGKSIAAYGQAAANNFNPFTDDINTIRGQESGYCTMNPLAKNRCYYFI